MIDIEVKKNWAQIKLCRPEVRNALSLGMMQQLTQFLVEVNTLYPQVRFLLLSGEGDHFCAGADLQDMKNAALKNEIQNQQEAQILYELFLQLWHTPLPVLTRVQGSVFGGALGLVALSDWVLADAGTQFCFSEVRLGLAPAVISDFILRKFNLASVQDLMLLAPTFGATQALERGLIHQVSSSAAESEEQWQAKVDSLLTLGPQALRTTKKLLRQMSLPPGMLPESQAERRAQVTQCIAQLRVSAEGQEGLNSFFTKRRPSWVTSQ